MLPSPSQNVPSPLGVISRKIAVLAQKLKKHHAATNQPCDQMLVVEIAETVVKHHAASHLKENPTCATEVQQRHLHASARQIMIVSHRAEISQGRIKTRIKARHTTKGMKKEAEHLSTSPLPHSGAGTKCNGRARHRHTCVVTTAAMGK